MLSMKTSNRTGSANVIKDLGDTLPAERKHMSTPRKVLVVGAVALSAAFAGTIVKGGGDVAHKAAHEVAGATANDPMFNHAPSTTFNAANEAKQDPSGVSQELQDQSHELYMTFKNETPTSVLNVVTVGEGMGPFAIVQESRYNGEKVTDDVTRMAAEQYIASQSTEPGAEPGQFQVGDKVILPPGFDVPGQTTQMMPAVQAPQNHEY